MTVEIEKQRGHAILMNNQVLTNVYANSSPVNLNGFDMVEIGIWYQAHQLAPIGMKVVFKIQLSFDGERYFDYATSLARRTASAPHGTISGQQHVTCACQHKNKTTPDILELYSWHAVHRMPEI